MLAETNQLLDRTSGGRCCIGTVGAFHPSHCPPDSQQRFSAQKSPLYCSLLNRTPWSHLSVRNHSLVMLLVLLLASVQFVSPVESGVPVVIIVTVNDLGARDFGFSGNPNGFSAEFLDPFAKGTFGKVLRNYYTYSNSKSSKLSLLTGVHPAVFGEQAYEYDVDGSIPQKLDTKKQPLISEIFKEHFHSRNHFIGSWGLGRGRDSLPTDRGFDSFYGQLFDNGGYLNHSFTDCKGHSGRDFFDFDGSTKRVVSNQDNVFKPEALFERAKERISDHAGNHRNKPLLLILSLQLAQTTDPSNCPVPEKTYSEETCYLRMLKSINVNFKKITDTLKEETLMRNSIIVFTGLSSAPLGADSQNGASNDPYRGSQGDLFEGGFRTGAFIYSQLLEEAKVIEAHAPAFSVSDWVPTLTYKISKTMGVPDPFACIRGDLCGKNQWKCLEKSGPCEEDRTLLLSLYKDGGALIWKNYKYLSDISKPTPTTEGRCAPSCAASHGWFYDLTKDPHEDDNVVCDICDSDSNYFHIISNLREKLVELNNSADYSAHVYKQDLSKLPAYNNGVWGYYDDSHCGASLTQSQFLLIATNVLLTLLFIGS